MKISDSIHCNNKRLRFNYFSNSSVLQRKKPRPTVLNTASVYIKPVDIPLISTASCSPCKSFCLKPYKLYTIGRRSRRCEFIFEDRRVSKQHCQLFFDALNRKIYIADGVFSVSSSECCSGFRVSMNGVFVNGVRIGRGEVAELCAGDEMSLVCGNEGACSLGIRIGFVVERIIFTEEVVDKNVSYFRLNGSPLDHLITSSEYDGLVARANLLLGRCKHILFDDDPLSYIREFVASYCKKVTTHARQNRGDNNFDLLPSNLFQLPVRSAVETKSDTPACRAELSPIKRLIAKHSSDSKWAGMGQLSSFKSYEETIVVSEVNPDPGYCDVNGEHAQGVDNAGVPLMKAIAIDKLRDLALHSMDVKDVSQYDKVVTAKTRGVFVPPPGSKFYLNRLEYVGQDSPSDHTAISLPELLYPMEGLVRVFIATFTSDISWFLSYCEIPAHLPVTIACHNVERCWSSSADKRTSVPYSNYPNLVVVYPPFPEAIAFGNNRKRSGIACHHPKLFVLQREDNVRVIITSANLVPKQWHSVTNTVWWQDFPHASIPDYLSLFTRSSDGEINMDSNPDFAAQLAGFIASLVADVPCQAYWITELTKYDFKGAVGHLVASIPGIYSHRAPYILESTHYLTGTLCVPQSRGVKLLGTVEASVVGLSHLFHASADSKGVQLKKLASFLGKCHENAYGMSEIVLRRNRNIPADANAVSVLIPNPEEFSEGDCVQLGFLPRNVAKWVAPLSDSGLFAFSAYIYRKEALATALEGSNNRVRLILYVSQGPLFSDISEVVRPEHVSAICGLVASIQRYAGLWRLQEVLGLYKWPEHLERDFLFGSSSIGSVNAHFLAAFSAAAGKRSLQFYESEESDPDWGCWSASQELRNPSIRIIFPTIERVKNASCGILASKYILSFSQKAWERLRNVGMLHDAIPYPSGRVGHPMHVKVARRRFQSKAGGSSFGWVYCGSHNFSAAAWGRPISNSHGTKINGIVKPNSVLGSRLHVCNYELGIIFIVPPCDAEDCAGQKSKNLDDISLPFVVPAPKYRPEDRPATAQAMREAWGELVEEEGERDAEAAAVGESMDEEIPEEGEEVLEAVNYVEEEKEDEKAYAERLWSQVDSSESC